ncbi:unnamed protein product [Pleuronectes platessa]|uniref:Uncharacterized protein n=1 Tax=Pleuronectes platessa TaxID=8262 RepID=A0A9N7W0U9_PLEPL|nr:unnamed protein product [Pleuronectes platessa]
MDYGGVARALRPYLSNAPLLVIAEFRHKATYMWLVPKKTERLFEKRRKIKTAEETAAMLNGGDVEAVDDSMLSLLGCFDYKSWGRNEELDWVRKVWQLFKQKESLPAAFPGITHSLWTESSSSNSELRLNTTRPLQMRI